MKNNKLTLLIFLLLAIAAAVLIITNKKSTIKEVLKDFAVQDTSSITKIFMTTKEPSSVTLIREGPGQWTVNGKFAARNDAMNDLLETIKEVSVRTPVAKSAMDNVLKALATSSTKVEIYSKDLLMKTYYVGSYTQDMAGTFMMVENSKTPFVTFIPGFNGYLSTRYFTEEPLWRDRTIYNYYPDEIATISIEYPKLKHHSFTINAKTFTVTSDDETEKPIMDTAKVGLFVGQFKHINFEGFADGVPKDVKDSILSSSPICNITVTDTKGTKDRITGYLKMVNLRDSLMEDEHGNPVKYDVDRMFALINNGKDFVVIQHFIFDAIMVSYDYFKKSIPNKPKA